MPNHVFKVGQLVRILPHLLPRVARNQEVEAARTQFEVVRLMPESGSAFQYRIKNKASGQERLVTETEIFSPEH
jgi:hypothetical protein